MRAERWGVALAQNPKKKSEKPEEIRLMKYNKFIRYLINHAAISRFSRRDVSILIPKELLETRAAFLARTPRQQPEMLFCEHCTCRFIGKLDHLCSDIKVHNCFIKRRNNHIRIVQRRINHV